MGPGRVGRGLVARAAVTTGCDDAGRSRVTRLRSDGPLALRECAGAVYLVGAAAGPLGGDEYVLELEVGAGSCLVVRQSAATLVLPGTGGTWSRLTVRAQVRAGGRLVYLPEPTVVAARARHRSQVDVAVAEGGALHWRERLVLGRHGERPDEVESRLDLTYAGAPLLRHELHLDAAAMHAGIVLDGATCVGTDVLVGPDVKAAEPVAEDLSDGTLGVFPLTGPGVLVSATASDAVRLAELLDQSDSGIVR